jgi:hypothetical protein
MPTTMRCSLIFLGQLPAVLLFCCVLEPCACSGQAADRFMVSRRKSDCHSSALCSTRGPRRKRQRSGSLCWCVWEIEAVYRLSRPAARRIPTSRKHGVIDTPLEFGFPQPHTFFPFNVPTTTSRCLSRSIHLMSIGDVANGGNSPSLRRQPCCNAEDGGASTVR